MKVISWLQAKLIDFFILNLFLTLVSLPILVAWGLPISWLSPLGNFIFSPFLSIFLLISTVSFFCELIALSHTYLDRLLEATHAVWYKLLVMAPQKSYITCSQTTFYFVTAISVITCILCMLPFFRSAQKRLIALLILFLCVLATLKILQPFKLNTSLPCSKKNISLIRDNNQTVLFDEGAFCERSNPASWVQYHLVPDLIRTTGSLEVAYLIIPRPTIRALQAATALIQHADVKTIFYPPITGELTGSYRNVFRKWYAIARSNNVTLRRVYCKTDLQIGDTTLTLVPDSKIQYCEITFNSVRILRPGVALA